MRTEEEIAKNREERIAAGKEVDDISVRMSTEVRPVAGVDTNVNVDVGAAGVGADGAAIATDADAGANTGADVPDPKGTSAPASTGAASEPIAIPVGSPPGHPAGSSLAATGLLGTSGLIGGSHSAASANRPEGEGTGVAPKEKGEDYDSDALDPSIVPRGGGMFYSVVTICDSISYRGTII